VRATNAHTRADFAAPAHDGLRVLARHDELASGRAGGPGIEVELEPGPAAAAEARAALGVLDGRMPSEALEDIRLLVSELVTNSVRHSGATRGASVRLTVATRGRSVRVEVIDAGRGFEPKPRSKPHDEAGGWGLHLVEQIADRWGVTSSRGARVWFEIDSG
jgi:anti-sigma regulatory factor (Ser/Thr protein kinase)